MSEDLIQLRYGGGYNDIDHLNHYIYGWRSILAQKMPLVYYREGSDEIVGLNWTFIAYKEDQFFENLCVHSKSPVTKTLFDVAHILYEDFEVFEDYGVDKYMGSLALSVDKKYRGRAIGDHFLATRKKTCKEFGVKVTHTIFSSNFSSRNAENVGFKTDRSISYDEINRLHPEYGLSNVKSDAMVIKSLVIYL